MSDLFPKYGLFLILASFVLVLAGMNEAGIPVVPLGLVIVARYPLCLRIACVVFLLVCLFFALALASVHREPPLARLGIWSTLGVPALAVSAEVFSRRITLDAEFVSRSSFYQPRFSRPRSSVSAVTYHDSAKVFIVHFVDGATLRFSVFVRGSQQVARALRPEPL